MTRKRREAVAEVKQERCLTDVKTDDIYMVFTINLDIGDAAEKEQNEKSQSPIYRVIL